MSTVIGDPRPAGEEGPAGDQRAAGEAGPAGDPRPGGEEDTSTSAVDGPPAQSAVKDEWVTYAQTQGYDPDEGATKQQLIDRYGA